MKKFIQSNPLLFIVLFPWIVDIIVTLMGQDQAYWRGYVIINEAHPVYHYLLSVHPFFFIAGNIVELTLIYLFVKFLPRPLNLMLVLGYGIGTAWSSSSWTSIMLSHYFPGQQIHWFLWDCIYFTILGIISGLSMDWYIIRQTSHTSHKKQRRNPPA